MLRTVGARTSTHTWVASEVSTAPFMAGVKLPQSLSQFCAVPTLQVEPGKSVHVSSACGRPPMQGGE
jgi:hypothetical protein